MTSRYWLPWLWLFVEFVIAFLVGRDLRDRGASTAWGAGAALLCIFVLPIGLALWLLGARRHPRRPSPVTGDSPAPRAGD